MAEVKISEKAKLARNDLEEIRESIFDYINKNRVKFKERTISRIFESNDLIVYGDDRFTNTVYKFNVKGGFDNIVDVSWMIDDIREINNEYSDSKELRLFFDVGTFEEGSNRSAINNTCNTKYISTFKSWADQSVIFSDTIGELAITLIMKMGRDQYQFRMRDNRETKIIKI